VACPGPVHLLKSGCDSILEKKGFSFLSAYAGVCMYYPPKLPLSCNTVLSICVHIASFSNLSSPGLASIQSCSLETVMDEPVSCVRLRTSYQLPRGLHVEKHLHRDRGLHAEKHLHRDKCHATFLLPPEDQRLGEPAG
jgi:hypothetical protein